jgi:molecular chaperone DnaJ
MKKRDYYEVLGVSKTATDDEIKKAYRRLAMKCHPDRDPDDKTLEAKFKELSEAYEVLSDPSKKSLYDEHGSAWKDNSREQAQNDAWAQAFKNFANQHFNHGGQGEVRGRDVSSTVTITLEEVMTGVEEQVQVLTLVTCKPCNGSGSSDGNVVKCSACGGMGYNQTRQGNMITQQGCQACRGRGKVIPSPCPTCRSVGRHQDTRTINVKIPAGMSSGDRIRYTGEGAVGELGAPPGDLYIFVDVVPHSTFARDGSDLHCKVTIDFTLAALGGNIQVPTMDGDISLKIPPGTQSNQVLRVRGKGTPTTRSPQLGDLLYIITVKTPIDLTEQQQKLLEKYRKTLGDSYVSHTVDVWS